MKKKRLSGILKYIFAAGGAIVVSFFLVRYIWPALLKDELKKKVEDALKNGTRLADVLSADEQKQARKQLAIAFAITGAVLGFAVYKVIKDKTLQVAAWAGLAMPTLLGADAATEKGLSFITAPEAPRTRQPQSYSGRRPSAGALKGDSESVTVTASQLSDMMQSMTPRIQDAEFQVMGDEASAIVAEMDGDESFAGDDESFAGDNDDDFA